MSQRQIVIGDVHGCIDELDELLRTVQFARDQDRLIFVGDLIDRGPDSVGVVRRARELRVETTVGNHEQKYLKYRLRQNEVRAGLRAKNEVQFGLPKVVIFNQLTDEDWLYIELMPLMIDLGDGFVVTHAGFEPALPMDQQRPEKMVRIVWVNDKGTMATNKDDFRKQPENARRWAEMFAERSVVYGHAIFGLEDPVIDHTGDATHYGIDTGCYAGGRLTAWVREPGCEPTIVQVQAKRVYQPRHLFAEASQ